VRLGLSEEPAVTAHELDDASSLQVNQAPTNFGKRPTKALSGSDGLEGLGPQVRHFAQNVVDSRTSVTAQDPF
jgi:hypothetical protein